MFSGQRFAIFPIFFLIFCESVLLSADVKILMFSVYWISSLKKQHKGIFQPSFTCVQNTDNRLILNILCFAPFSRSLATRRTSTSVLPLVIGPWSGNSL